MRLSLLAVACGVSVAASAPLQPPKSLTPGPYSFVARTAAYDPQFDAWRALVVADSFQVYDPTGVLFLASVMKIVGDTLTWTDVQGPCTGVVSRYKVGRDSIGVTLDLIDDQCSDRAAAIPNMYITPTKSSGGGSPPERPFEGPAARQY